MSFICSVPIIANLFSACLAAPPLAVGYVEGEHVLLAPVEVASVQTLAVKRGDKVFPGMVLATLEDADAKIALSEAEAALARLLASASDDPEGLLLLGRLRYLQRNCPEAEAVLRRHLSARPDSLNGLMQLAFAQLCQQIIM